ncbi:MAG: hypothetical protein C0490_12610 [Marivirga sp.]|nr:hypothetical protein [Marivirga sp.]
MKSIFLSCILLLTCHLIHAQELITSQVPAPVTKALSENYPETSSLKWEKKKETYKAGFKVGKIDHDVWFTNEGKIVKHRLEIKEEDLPVAVKETIKKEFGNYKVGECEKTEENQTVTYKVELKDAEGKKKKVNISPEGKVIPKSNS